MKEKQKPAIEIVHKITESQKKDNKIGELEGRIVKLEEDNIEMRNMLIQLRKDIFKENKKTNKDKKVDIDQ